ncbi:hypothetical protein MKK65_20680 [Methylobacterium sp. J-001]|uniref:hypothetical protein n=1 Tax=Methylobacterium sp. J-001 TaxID=2836609 RepID=UPI001FBAD30E|nr:hypothetical protein [Methylobacterium sp. J-001]MCJ2118951.1 hypothetical protein [Methylobacterium sp. J-001]
MPMFCGVIGGTGLMLAALTVLMADQMASSHRTVGHAADASSVSARPAGAHNVSSDPQPPAHGVNP